jgi:hypothetical protein
VHVQQEWLTQGIWGANQVGAVAKRREQSDAGTGNTGAGLASPPRTERQHGGGADAYQPISYLSALRPLLSKACLSLAMEPTLPLPGEVARRLEHILRLEG